MELRTEYTRERLQVRARALSQDYKIEVRWGSAAYTDGSRVYLPGRGRSPIDALGEVELLVSLHALAIHEAAHIRYSSWEVLGEIEKLPEEEQAITRHVLNVLEDARVELLVANSHPGTRDYLRFFNDLALERWIPSLEKISMPGEQFLLALAQSAICGRLKGAPAREVGELLEEVKPLVGDARRSTSPWKPLQAARQIVERMKERWGLPKPPVVLAFRVNSLEGCRNSSREAEKRASHDLAGRELEELHPRSRGEKGGGKEGRGIGGGRRDGASAEELMPEELKERVRAELRRAERERAAKEREIELEGEEIKTKVDLVEGGASGEYHAICAGIAGLRARLSRELRDLLTARCRTARGLKKGRLDPTRLHRVAFGREDVYYKKSLKGGEGVGFLLLVDESGSMETGNRYLHARRAAVLFSEVLRGLRIRHMVVGFSADEASKISLDLRVYRAFSDPHSRPSTSIARIAARANNRDGPAIRAATEYLERQRFQKKVLLVVSDGEPFARGYSPPESVEDTARAVREAKRKGIRVIGISIDPSAGNYLGEIYPSRVVVKRLDELPKKLLRVARRELL
jgi:Mg-chelatase subunit ChlD